MANVCNKTHVMFAWALLECLLFSGIAFGWAWLTEILKYDGYFSHLCNETNTSDNITTSARGLLSMDHVEVTSPGSILNHTLLGMGLKDSALNEKVVEININDVNNLKYFTHNFHYNHYNRFYLHRYSELLKDTQYHSQTGDIKLQKRDGHAKASPLVEGIEDRRHRRSTTVPVIAHMAPRYGNYTTCALQEDRLALMYAVIFMGMNSLTILAGIFFDRYGTMRTRLVAVLLFTVSTLMVTFSSPDLPWLIVIALTLLAIGGNMILMTNLQVANLMGSRRYTAMATLIGAHDSGSLVVPFMKFSYMGGINLQTSFMFLTICVVPLLVSTIAFLPKIRIPWPLPANYGKKRGVQVDELALKQQAAWQRRVSAASCQLRMKARSKPSFCMVASQSMLLLSLLWFSVQQAKDFFFNTNVKAALNSTGANDNITGQYAQHNAVIQMLGILVAPVIGLILDRQNKPTPGSPPGVRQMQNIIVGIFVSSGVAIVANSLSLVPVLWVQMLVCVLQLIVRQFIWACMIAFLAHVHFPQEQFGRLLGLTTVVGSLFCALHFPARYFLTQRLHNDPFYINLTFLTMSVLTLIHPVNVWKHCRQGLIKDMSSLEIERRRKSSCAEPLVQRHQIQCRASDESPLTGNGFDSRKMSREFIATVAVLVPDVDGDGIAQLQTESSGAMALPHRSRDRLSPGSPEPSPSTSFDVRFPSISSDV